MATSDRRRLTFCILASGPSLCREDVDVVRQWRDGVSRRVISVNNCYQLAPWADLIYACDERWWDRYHDDVAANCRGEFWTYYEATAKRYGLRQWQPERTGGNSGYQAIRLAVDHYGADRLILLGFDMQGGHWHGQHGGDFPNPDKSNFKQWIGWLDRYAKETMAEIINASRETAVHCFPRMSLEDALSDRLAA